MKKETGSSPGRFLSPADREALRQQRRSNGRRSCRRYLMVTVLLLWDGLLLYMIVRCLIDGVYGAVFMTVISIYLGYHLK